MRVLIVVPQQDRISGNWVTATRFQEGLTALGEQVMIHEVALGGSREMVEQVSRFAPDVVILLHAYRSGKPWLECGACQNIPFVVILTGTDVNQGLEDPVQGPVIHQVLQQAAIVALQNPLLAEELARTQPQLAAQIRHLPPGVIAGNSPYDLRRKHGVTDHFPLFLCPAGLRKVKGILELVDMFDRVAEQSRDFHLCLCGPILEPGYGARVLEAVERRPWSKYLGAIPTQAMTNAMRGADVILNNSHAEGIANSLLEAATLGKPILARKIPGNAAVVEHNVNGLLYSDADEFTRYALRLLSRKERQKLSHPRPDRYKPESEAVELAHILKESAGLNLS